MDAGLWNTRYTTTGYVYGTIPNAFVAEVAAQIPAGPVLCLAEGEGRNAVHLAVLGHAVTAVDLSAVALAKARRLAAERGVSLATVVTDLVEYRIAPGTWSGIVATFMHLPPLLRREVLVQAVAGLAPGGVFVFEAYTPSQLAYDTGGPRDLGLLVTAAQLREELVGLDLVIARELERDVREGTGHTGRGAVVQILGRRP
jgi:SAM-dependent methyltransferase